MTKKPQILLLIISILFSLSGLAESRSRHALSTSYLNEEFTGQLSPGFHFNDKAPNSIIVNQKKLKPSMISDRQIKFNLKNNKVQNDTFASLYVCDDAKTYCETHKVMIIENNKDLKNNQAKAALAQPKQTRLSYDKNGFLLNNYDQAIGLAGQQKKPILISFTAKWCPGCVRYKNEIFNTNEFKKVSKNFIKLSIDVDLIENFSIGEKFKIKGIPTIVVIDANQSELDRLVDFQMMPKLKKFLNTVEADLTPIDQLLDKKSFKDENDKRRAVSRMLATQHLKEGLELGADLNPKPYVYNQAQFDHILKQFENKELDEKKLVTSLESLISSEKDSFRSIYWRQELYKHQSEERKKQTLEEAQNLKNKWLANSADLKMAIAEEDLGEYTGYEKIVLMMVWADFIDIQNLDKSAMTKHWQETAEIAKSYQDKKTANGVALRYLIILTLAEKYDLALKQADDLLKKDPSNLDIKRRKIKVLLELKKYSDAEVLAKEIIHNVEGRNEFWVAESLAKAYLGQNKKEEAKTHINAYLIRSELSEKKLSGLKKSFEELLKKCL
jgi:thiol-disulfide isomerase/thioredoxin